MADADTSTQQSIAAQERLQRVLAATHAQFAKFDDDNSGSLDVDELVVALNSLGKLKGGGGRELTVDDAHKLLDGYDADHNGRLNSEEFSALLVDLALSGRFTFRPELQQDLELITHVVKDDPWISVKQDRDVRNMIDALRDAAIGASRQRRGLRRISTMMLNRPSSLMRSSTASNLNAAADEEAAWIRAVPAAEVHNTPPSSSRFGRVCRLCCFCCRWLPIINPDGRLRTCWNVMTALLIIYCGVAVPLEIAFEGAMQDGMGPDGWRVWELWTLFVDAVFLLDIVLNFRTSFLNEGHMVRDDLLIASHYLRGAFVIDLLGSFPLNFVLSFVNDDGETSATSRLNRQLRLLRIIKINRLLRLAKLSKKLKYFELVIKFNPAVMRMAKLLVMMMLMCHWLGCTWWFVCEMELADSVPMNAFHPSPSLLQSETLGPQFAAAFLWGAGLITAMVPYDIMPVTEVEIYLTAVCMLVGLMINAFAIGSAASALSQIDSKKALTAGKLETIGAYLHINRVSPELRCHILEYYEYLYTSTQSMQDLRIYQDLPPALAMRLAITVHRRILSRCPALCMLSDDALLGVLGRLKPRIYIPSQVVLIEGQEHRSVMFLKRGKVVLIKAMGTPDETLVRTVAQYDNFGLALGDSARMAVEGGVQLATETARAETYCDVISLDLADLGALIAKERLWSKIAPSNAPDPAAVNTHAAPSAEASPRQAKAPMGAPSTAKKAGGGSTLSRAARGGGGTSRMAGPPARIAPPKR